jgi:lathosterol oxidase
MNFIIISHIVGYDVWFYITHIFLHHPTIYVIHKIHHSTKYDKLKYYDVNTGHIIEHVVQPLGIFLPIFWYGFLWKAFLIANLIIVARGLMRHDHRFAWLIGNHHLLHHKYPKYNLGEYWIDVLCGTVYPRKEEYIHGLIYT